MFPSYLVKAELWDRFEVGRSRTDQEVGRHQPNLRSRRVQIVQMGLKICLGGPKVVKVGVMQPSLGLYRNGKQWNQSETNGEMLQSDKACVGEGQATSCQWGGESPGEMAQALPATCHSQTNVLHVICVWP
jgi:hypothetical protein